MDLLTHTINPVDTAYSHVRELIMDAALLPNTHHLEHHFADELSIEPKDVHSSACRLEAEGLVRVDSMGGFWITPLSIDEVIAIYNRAAVLEARAAYIAATNGANPLALSALYDAVRTMEDALYRRDITRWARADHHFHRSLLQCSSHPALIGAALTLSEPLHRARMLTLRFQELPYERPEAYARLLDAISMGAGVEAHDLHMAHWQSSSNAIVDLLNRNLMASASY